MRIRKAIAHDIPGLTVMCSALWPDASAGEHEAEVSSMLRIGKSGGLPAAYFLADIEGRAIGFVQVGMRSHADGFDPEHPPGFVEGWFVEPEFRGRGVGAALIREAESWARTQGCGEMASDTWLDKEPSQRAHEALGYEVVDRCVHYRKPLR